MVKAKHEAQQRPAFVARTLSVQEIVPWAMGGAPGETLSSFSARNSDPEPKS